MSIPLSSACSPLALEIIIGRVPCVATGTAAPTGSARPKSLPAPAAKLLASEVRKNLRRDHGSIACLLNTGVQYTSEGKRLEVVSVVYPLVPSGVEGDSAKGLTPTAPTRL